MARNTARWQKRGERKARQKIKVKKERRQERYSTKKEIQEKRRRDAERRQVKQTERRQDRDKDGQKERKMACFSVSERGWERSIKPVGAGDRKCTCGNTEHKQLESELLHFPDIRGRSRWPWKTFLLFCVFLPPRLKMHNWKQRACFYFLQKPIKMFARCRVEMLAGVGATQIKRCRGLIRVWHLASGSARGSCRKIVFAWRAVSLLGAMWLIQL